ncbi:hypothetical protein EP331_15855 [bacterium]|nr:MAG: hypothetical protein EP331_15855 [bacterium]
MEISRVIAQLLESLRPLEQLKPVAGSNAENFQDLLKNQTQTPKTPVKPLPPSATLHLNQQAAQQQFYNKQGQLIQLSIYRNQTLAKTQESTTAANQIAQNKTEAPEFKWPSEIMATLLQLSFDFIREQLKREDRQKRERNKSPKLPDGKAEEAALELLEILFEQFDEAEDRLEYCIWARESIQRAEDSIREQYTNLPPEVELRFKIMHDAITALEHGIEPDYIRERLSQEINRKKNRN